MKESVRSLKSSEVCAVEYCTATSSVVVVDMGASLQRASTAALAYSVTKGLRLLSCVRAFETAVLTRCHRAA